MTATTTETAASITRQLYDEVGYQPDEITKRLFADLGVGLRAGILLYPWVRDRVQHECSRYARRDGRQGSSASQEAREDHDRQHEEGSTIVRSQRVLDSQGTHDPRLKFLDAHVPCPGAPSGMKLYKFFTVDDHQSRQGLHQANLDGAARRIAGHRWAVDEIKRYGVEVLAQIPAGLLAQDLPDTGVAV